MGNCQAIDNATLVIQHPCGKVEKLYWPVTVNEIMKMNPGYYVALLLTTTLCPSNPPAAAAAAAAAAASADSANKNSTTNNNTVRITRIKLLRPTDTLVLGRVYRLIAAQEVMKGLRAKKHANMKNNQSESDGKQERLTEKTGSGSDIGTAVRRSQKQKSNQVTKHERHRPRAIISANSAPVPTKSRAWQPSLQSISEAAS